MLTTDDKEAIKRIVGEAVANSLVAANEDRKRADAAEKFERFLMMIVQMHELVVKEGRTDLTYLDAKTGETIVVEAKSLADTKPEAKFIVEVTARAMEVFGSREKALRWLNTPVRALGDQTPLSVLNTPEGAAQVQDTLGRVEHGVW